MNPTRAHIEMILALMSLGANVAVSKWLADRVAADLFMLLRFLVAVPILFALALIMDRVRPSAMVATVRKFAIPLFVLGAVGAVFYTLFLLEGVKRTTSLDAGLISATMPIFVLIWAFVLMRVRPSPAGYAAVSLAVFGLIILNWESGSLLGQGMLIGNLLVAMAFASEAFFVVRSKQLLAHMGPLELGFWMHFAGLIIMCCWIFGTGTPLDFPSDLKFWVVALAYIGSAAVVAIIFFNRAIPHLSTQVSAVYSVIVPVTAFFVAWIFMGDTPQWLDWFALALLGIAMLLAALRA